MIAKLIFKLPEERDDFEMANNAARWKVAVADIFDELRKRCKYGDAGEEMQQFYEWLNGYLNDNGVHPWE